jgi:hypothetical protein
MIDLIRNYADGCDDIIFEQDFHDEILDTVLEEERETSAVLNFFDIKSINSTKGTTSS